jgi:hypothetical protein
MHIYILNVVGLGTPESQTLLRAESIWISDPVTKRTTRTTYTLYVPHIHDAYCMPYTKVRGSPSLRIQLVPDRKFLPERDSLCNSSPTDASSVVCAASAAPVASVVPSAPVPVAWRLHHGLNVLQAPGAHFATGERGAQAAAAGRRW